MWRRHSVNAAPHLVLRFDLRRGSHLHLEVDAAAMRQEVIEFLHGDAQRILRQAHKAGERPRAPWAREGSPQGT
jgi:hypothetical protein